tara:strand:+ start:337 stop:558 length:222 start_codon:yes stop_codon:yes gene_type:complete
MNGQWRKGIRDLNKAIKIVPNHASALADRSVMKEMIGDLKGACNDMQEANLLGYEYGSLLLKGLSKKYSCPEK